MTRKLGQQPEMTVVTEYFEEVATTAEVEAVLVGSAGKYWRLERFESGSVSRNKEAVVAKQ